jgi:hypothetical protein
VQRRRADLGGFTARTDRAGRPAGRAAVSLTLRG